MKPSLWQAALEIGQTYWPSFAYGLGYTLILALVGTLVGLVIGLGVGTLRIWCQQESRSWWQQALQKITLFLTKIYIEVFRGTPMMVQAVFIYHSIRPLLNWSPFEAGLVIISINTGAYMAEIVRGGIQSIDPGQMEAGRSLGLSFGQTMRLVVLPQAIKNIFPSIGNELIVNIKDSSVLNVISVTELFFQSSSIAGSVFQYRETFLLTALIYLTLTLSCSFILNKIEEKLNHQSIDLPTSDTSLVHYR